MKIYGAKKIKEGVNPKTQKKWELVGFRDENGRQLSSFDTLLLDIEDGTDVKGTVTETESNGNTYYNFKMDKVKPEDNVKPYPIKDVPKKVDQSVWDRKDKMMQRMSALKASSTLYEGTGGDKRNDMLQYAEECYKWITGDFEAKEEAPPSPPLPTDDEIDISDVPF